MSPDYNYSYASEKAYDNLHERYEDIGEDPICSECKGENQTQYCITCGLHHEECECDEPDLITEECEKCMGGMR